MPDATSKREVNLEEMNGVLDRVIGQMTLLEGEIEEQSQDDVDPDELYDNPFDEYIYSLVDKIEDKYDLEDEECSDLILSVADIMAVQNQLPAIPEQDASAGEFVQWTAAAKTSGFDALVMKYVDKELAGSDLEWGPESESE